MSAGDITSELPLRVFAAAVVDFRREMTASAPLFIIFITAIVHVVYKN